MTSTIHYYLGYIKHNNRRTTIDFTDFIDSIMNHLQPNEKYKVLRSGSMSMIEMAYPEVNNPQTVQNRKVAIGKYRDRRPYAGTRGTDIAAQIADDVLEITPVVFLPISKLVLIEYNHFGARPKNIVQYLNTFLPNNEDDNWEIEFVPLAPERGIQDVLDSEDIRSLEFVFNLEHAPIRTETDANENGPVSLLYNLIDNYRDLQNEVGGRKGKASFNNGRGRGNSMNTNNLAELIAALDFQQDVFESVKVKYLSPMTGRVEDIDLKNSDIYKRIILEDDDNDGWEYVADAIQTDFYENGRPKENAWINEEANRTLEPIGLPQLRIG